MLQPHALSYMHSFIKSCSWSEGFLSGLTAAAADPVAAPLLLLPLSAGIATS